MANFIPFQGGGYRKIGLLGSEWKLREGRRDLNPPSPGTGRGHSKYHYSCTFFEIAREIICTYNRTRTQHIHQKLQKCSPAQKMHLSNAHIKVNKNENTRS